MSNHEQLLELALSMKLWLVVLIWVAGKVVLRAIDLGTRALQLEVPAWEQLARNLQRQAKALRDESRSGYLSADQWRRIDTLDRLASCAREWGRQQDQRTPEDRP